MPYIKQCIISSLVPPYWLTWFGDTRKGVSEPVAGALGFVTTFIELDFSSSTLSDGNSMIVDVAINNNTN